MKSKQDTIGIFLQFLPLLSFPVFSINGSVWNMLFYTIPYFVFAAEEPILAIIPWRDLHSYSYVRFLWMYHNLFNQFSLQEQVNGLLVFTIPNTDTRNNSFTSHFCLMQLCFTGLLYEPIVFDVYLLLFDCLYSLLVLCCFYVSSYRYFSPILVLTWKVFKDTPLAINLSLPCQTGGGERRQLSEQDKTLEAFVSGWPLC